MRKSYCFIFIVSVQKLNTIYQSTNVYTPLGFMCITVHHLLFLYNTLTSQSYYNIYLGIYVSFLNKSNNIDCILSNPYLFTTIIPV